MGCNNDDGLGDIMWALNDHLSIHELRVSGMVLWQIPSSSLQRFLSPL